MTEMKKRKSAAIDEMMIWESSSSECNASGFGRGRGRGGGFRNAEGRNGANLDNLQTLKGMKERRLGEKRETEDSVS